LKKLSPNAPCPCGSGKKYKKCCQVYHKGAVAKDALSLMRSRYAAYAAGACDYIIRTTHPDNPEYSSSTKSWQKRIEAFCTETDFLGLEIEEYHETEGEAFVTFCAMLSGGEMRERSRFLKEAGRWLYVDGELRAV